MKPILESPRTVGEAARARAAPACPRRRRRHHHRSSPSPEAHAFNNSAPTFNDDTPTPAKTVISFDDDESFGTRLSVAVIFIL